MRQQHPIQEFDGIRFYRKPQGYFKADYVKHGNLYMHRHVWEKHNGPIPQDFHIHHKDGDKSNNAIENLELLAQAEHLSKHNRQRCDANPGWWADGLRKARDAAKKWHSSDEGRQCHSKIGLESWVGRPLRDYSCAHCGKGYQALAGAVKNGRGFCGNNCKSAARRASGVDNEHRQCCVCAAQFSCNKYSTAKTCGKACRQASVARKSPRLRSDGA